MELFFECCFKPNNKISPTMGKPQWGRAPVITESIKTPIQKQEDKYQEYPWHNSDICPFENQKYLQNIIDKRVSSSNMLLSADKDIKSIKFNEIENKPDADDSTTLKSTLPICSQNIQNIR